MDLLKEVFGRLPRCHQLALQWFFDRTGEEQPWPEPLKGDDGEIIHLASRAKGIYKPKWSEYALSVRQTLDGHYPDHEPVMRDDGKWEYAYFQENKNPQARDDEFTNRGLVACLRDRIPVGVMRQVVVSPKVRYKILGIAFVAGWEKGYFFLEGFPREGVAR